MNDTDVVNIRWVDAQAVTVKPGDTIVLSYPHPMMKEEVQRLRHDAEALFPEQKVLILDNGMRLGVLTS